MGVGMNTYIVRYRKTAQAQTDSEVISAFRVEGWSNDYAFFGNPGDVNEVTRLIPRNLVESVEFYTDKHDRPLVEVRRLHEERYQKEVIDKK